MVDKDYEDDNLAAGLHCRAPRRSDAEARCAVGQQTGQQQFAEH